MATPSFLDHSAAGAVFASSLTVTVTLSAGTNRVAMAMAWCDRAGTTIDSATFDGTAMTAGSANADPSLTGQYRAFTYEVPDAKGAADYDVVFTFSNGSARVTGHAVIYKDADSIGTEVNGEGINASITPYLPEWTVSSATGDLVVALVMVGVATEANANPVSPATEAGFGNTNSFTYNVYHGAWQEAGAASVLLDGDIPSGGYVWLGFAWNLVQSTSASAVQSLMQISG